MHPDNMEIDVSTIQSGIPATNCTGVKFLFDWKNNMDYEILEQMDYEILEQMGGDNMEIDVDKKKMIAPEIKNERFNSLVCLSISLMNGKLVTVGRHYQILE